MRPLFSYTLLFALMFVIAFVLYGAYTTCQVPMTYSIGELDAEFQLTKKEAIAALKDAEALWEEAAGMELFTYQEVGGMTVNFIYDERQAYADAEAETRAELDEVKSVNQSLNEQYEALLETYNNLQQAYETKVAIYESDVEEYNDTVARYNSQGGAPKEAYEKLQNDSDALDQTRLELQEEEETLRGLVAQINELSERGNEVIASYNEEVEEYNETFGETREFTQGTYTNNGTIDIYSFESPYELRLVLAHELGHALGIGHVLGTESVMYFLIGGQSNPLVLTDEDKAAFMSMCGEGSFWRNFKIKTQELLTVFF